MIAQMIDLFRVQEIITAKMLPIPTPPALEEVFEDLAIGVLILRFNAVTRDAESLTVSLMILTTLF